MLIVSCTLSVGHKTDTNPLQKHGLVICLTESEVAIKNIYIYIKNYKVSLFNSE